MIVVESFVAAATIAETTAAFNAAIEAPTEEAINRLLSVLPLVTLPNGITNYIIEGDLRVSRDQLRVYLDDLQSRRTIFESTQPKLQLHEVNNKPVYLRTLQSRRLTYSIARSSFTPGEYTRLITDMSIATKDWIIDCPLCQIHFEYKSEYDASPSTLKTNFVLQKLDSRGAFVASAFFPDTTPANRYFFIDPLYFSDQSRIGVLKHGLGHILGYRHPHTEEMLGCVQQNGKWMPLHHQQSESLMQPVCSDSNIDPNLKHDINSHRCVYDIQYQQDHVDSCRSEPSPNSALAGPVGAAPNPQTESGSGPALRVRFHGGEIAENIVRVVELLLSENRIKSVSYQVIKGDSTCRIYKRVMDWPANVLCPASLMRLAARLNNTSVKAISRLKPGQKIQVVPHLVFLPYPSATINSPTQLPSQWEVSLKDLNRREFVYYELRFPLSERAELDKLNSIINGWRSPVIFSAIDTGESRLPPLHADTAANSILDHIDPAKFIARCEAGYRGRNIRAWYARLISTAGLNSCAKTCPLEGCVEVVLLDAAVQAHPNLKGAIVHPQMDFAADLDECTAVTDPANQAYHGTMMAGIIGAREAQYPFVGIAPASHIYSLDLTGKQSFDVADLITRYLGRRRVFVMASSYPTGGEMQLQDRRLLKRVDDRQKRLLGQTIVQNKPLIITAIGQPDDKTSFNMRSEIFKNSDFSPANLGDKDNVLVVTSCSDCSNENAQLDDAVHFSQYDHLVHLAAPGQDIPALASPTKLIHRVRGTSPATAFVAGTAAAMMNCHPTEYSEPHQVKFWLQLTARPVLRDGDMLKVQGGIIDADLALMKPSLTWLQRKGSPTYESVKVAAWCVDGIKITDPDSHDIVYEGYTQMSDVRRLYRLKVTSPDGDRYIVFKKPTRAGVSASDIETWYRGAIFHTAPGLPSIKGTLLKLSSEEFISIDQIEDLVLDRPVAEVVSCGAR
jgi:hypothetical protein